MIKFWVEVADFKITLNLSNFSSDIKSACCGKFRTHKRTQRRQAPQQPEMNTIKAPRPHSSPRDEVCSLQVNSQTSELSPTTRGLSQST